MNRISKIQTIALLVFLILLAGTVSAQVLIEKPEQTLIGHTQRILSVALSPDGTKAITGSWDQTTKIWDLRSGALLFTLENSSVARSVNFTPDGTQVYTCSSGYIKLWNVSDGTLAREYRSSSLRAIESVLMFPNGARFLTGGFDPASSFYILDVYTFKSLFQIMGPLDCLPKEFITISKDGTQFATAWKKTLQVWRTDDQTKLTEFLIDEKGNPEENPVENITFSPDGTKIFIAFAHDLAQTGIIESRDTTTGRLLKTVTIQDQDSFFIPFKGSTVFSLDSTLLLNNINVWEVASGKLLAKLRSSDKIGDSNATAFSPDSRKIITGNSALNPNLDYTPYNATVWDLSPLLNSGIKQFDQYQ